MNWQEIEEMIRLKHKYSRRGGLLLFISSIPFVLSFMINYVFIPVLSLGIEWRVIGLMFVLIAIGLVTLALFFLRTSFYWNKRLRESLKEPPWVLETDEQWRRTHQQQ